MSPREIPEGTNRPSSAAEEAMEANARSRDRQGKAEDHARRQRHVGVKGEGAAKPTRSINEARQDASADERAADEGTGEPRSPTTSPHARP